MFIRMNFLILLFVCSAHAGRSDDYSKPAAIFVAGVVGAMVVEHFAKPHVDYVIHNLQTASRKIFIVAANAFVFRGSRTWFNKVNGVDAIVPASLMLVSSVSIVNDLLVFFGSKVWNDIRPWHRLMHLLEA